MKAKKETQPKVKSAPVATSAGGSKNSGKGHWRPASRLPPAKGADRPTRRISSSAAMEDGLAWSPVNTASVVLGNRAAEEVNLLGCLSCLLQTGWRQTRSRCASLSAQTMRVMRARRSKGSALKWPCSALLIVFHFLAPCEALFQSLGRPVDQLDFSGFGPAKRQGLTPAFTFHSKMKISWPSLRGR